MKNLFATLFLIVCLGCGQSEAQNKLIQKSPVFRMPAGLTENDYMEATIVLKMKPEYRSYCGRNSFSVDELNIELRSLGVNGVEKIFPNHNAPVAERNASGQKLVDLSLIYQVKISAEANLEKSINRILSTGTVEYAEPYYVPHLFYTPNDPNIGLQNFLNKINAYTAWDTQMGDPNVVIGIVDTGTDWDHPDLTNQIKYNTADPINGIDDDADGYTDNYRGWDMADNDNDPMVAPNGVQTHGSHVSGCAAAQTDNNTGVASPGFNCKFLPVKTSKNSDLNAYLTSGYQGIVYAADHGCSIINCSWGGAGGGSFGQDAITYATINKNALVVCAAGNDGTEVVFYPSSYKYALSVASTTNTDGKSSFSNYGIHIDVCAPGSNIYSTVYNNVYGYSSGTSMASPVAAGAAAIVKSQYPSYNAMQVGEKLRMSCDNIYGVAGNGVYQDKLGRGRINMGNSLLFTTPSVRFENKLATDGNDDAFVVNDTISISGDFINYLDPTTNLNVVLSTTSPYVTIINNSFSIGALSTLASANNSAAPFKIKVNPTAPQNAKITLKLTFTDGLYSDFQLLEETVNVDYINITINDVLTTITSKGRLFWNTNAPLTEGMGFDYNGNQLVYDGGLMIGNNNNVSDNMRTTPGNFDEDFQSQVVVQRVIPSVFSEFDLTGKFNDNPASPQLDVLVTHKAFAWSTPGDTKYIIVEYSIKNNGTSPLNSLYAGIFCDWDVMDYTLNRGAEDAALKLGYVFSTEANGLYAGVKLLTAGPWKHYALDNITGGAGGVNMYDDYLSNEKYTTLSTNRAAAGIAGQGNDVCDVVSTGSFSLPVGDSVIVAFAILAGDDLADIQNSAVNAQIKYDGITSVNENNVTNIQLSVYPNPADEIFNINFSLNNTTPVSVNIYNTLGETLKNIEAGTLQKGKHSLQVDARNFAKGIYVCEMNVGGKIQTVKFAVTK